MPAVVTKGSNFDRTACAERVRYRLPKLHCDGRSQPMLLSPQLTERVATFVPPLRRHRVRYYGVLSLWG